MTRQSPDRLDYGTEHFSLYPFPSLLPLGHPRWEHCRIAPGDSTANYRGYGARWAVKDRRLFLQSFGGYADDGDGFGRHPRTKLPRRTIGMIDVHEVDVPIPATWISSDLICPAGQAPGTDWSDFIPARFVLFRVVHGLVVAETSISNTRRVADVHFLYEKALLNEVLTRGTQSNLQGVPGAVEGLAAALRGPQNGHSRQQLATMLWHAGEADLDDLIRALISASDPDVLRWIGYALARIGPDAADAIPHLMRVLSATSDPDVAKAMAYALAGIGPPAAPVFATMIPIVEACCGRRADDQILHFANNLAPAGEKMINALIAGMLVSRSGSIDARISWLLGEMGLAAVLPLYAAFLAADNDGQRSTLARALGCIGPGAGIALNALVDRLQYTQDDDARYLIAEAVAKIGLRSPDSLPALRPAFRSAKADWALRHIADAAASLGGGAVSFLIEEFEPAGKAGRIHIARALGEIGTSAVPAVGPLAAAAMTSTSRDLVVEVATSLKKIGAPDDVLFTVRIKALGCEPSGLWTQAALAEMQAALDAGLHLPEQDVWDLVALLIETGESATGRAVAKMLGAVGKAAAEPLLTALDQVRDQGTRVVIFHALGQVGEPAQSAIDDAVIALSAADNDRLRLQIVDDLVRMGRPDERHMATLAEVLLRSSFLPVWWRLGLVLAGFGSPAIATLIDILERSTDDGQRRAMANALIEAATSDASARTALLAAVRTAKARWTRDALQIALTQSAQR